MIVFDAEPLLAYYWDETGSDAVDELLASVDRTTGAISSVTCTEIHYLLERTETNCADEYLTRLRANLRVVDAGVTWQTASWFKRRHDCSLGDAYALAAAARLDGTLVVGADDDFDGVESVALRRFRTTAG